MFVTGLRFFVSLSRFGFAEKKLTVLGLHYEGSKISMHLFSHNILPEMDQKKNNNESLIDLN